METTRQQKFARLVQKELSQVFLIEGKSLLGNAFITVTQVKMTPDLGLARIHLSVLGAKNQEAIVEQINGHAKELRGMLGIRMKKQVRHIPGLQFFPDGSLDYAEKIEKLLNEAKGNPSKQ